MEKFPPKSVIKWWNEMNKANYVRQKQNLPKELPKKVSIDELTQFWANFSPQFLSLEKHASNRKKKYSACVEAMLESICNEKPPSLSFSNSEKFILFLYKFRDILHPQTVKDCIKLARTCTYPKNLWFFSQQFPLMIQNPILLFETFECWRLKKSKYWDIFVCDDKGPSTILDKYLPLYQPIYQKPSFSLKKTKSATQSSSSSSTPPKKKRYSSREAHTIGDYIDIGNVSKKRALLHRNYILRLAMSVIKGRKRKGGNVDSVCSDFIIYASNNIQLFDLELGANLIRCVFECISMISNNYDDKSDFITNFLAASSKTCFSSFVSKYIHMKYQDFVDKKAATKNFITISSLEDLKFFEKWMCHGNALQAASLLINAAFNQVVFNRASIKILCTLISSFQSQRVQILLSSFIRKSFVFIAKCKIMNKNIAQVASIFYNFMMMQKHAPWLAQLISKCAGSLKKTQTNPSTMLFFIRPTKHDPILTRMICSTFNIIIKRRPVKRRVRKMSNQYPRKKTSSAHNSQIISRTKKRKIVREY